MAKTWVDYYNQITSGGRANVRPTSIGSNSSGRLSFAPSPNAAFGQFGNFSGTNSAQKKPQSTADILKTALMTVNPAASVLLGDEGSYGNRALDILSRPLYASASVGEGLAESMLKATDPKKSSVDFGELLSGVASMPKNAWEGLSGQNKVTYGDIRRDQFNGSESKWMIPVDLTMDILGDPTSYIGVGLGKHIATGTKQAATIAKGAKAAENVVKKGIITKQGAKALAAGQPVEFNGGAWRDLKDLPKSDTGLPIKAEQFIESLKAKNLAGDVPSASTLSNLPATPTADLIAARAAAEAADSVASKVTAFKYGNTVDNIPESGFFEQIDVPNPKYDPKAGLNEWDVMDQGPKSLVPYNAKNFDAAKVDEFNAKYPFPVDNPIARTILNALDEPVYTEYKQVVEAAGKDSKKGATFNIATTGEDATTVGALRQSIAENSAKAKNHPDPRVREIAARELSRQQNRLIRHIQAVTEYAMKHVVENPHSQYKGAKRLKSGVKSGAARFMDDYYGPLWKYSNEGGKGSFSDFYAKYETDAALKNVQKLSAKQTAKGVKVQPPTIAKWEKMSATDKMEWLILNGVHQLDDADFKLLNSARTQAQFAQRLRTIQTSVTNPTGFNDLLKAIQDGRVSSLDHYGLRNVFKHFGVKWSAKDAEGSLQRLATALQRVADDLTDAEKSLLDKLDITSSSLSAKSAMANDTVVKTASKELDAADNAAVEAVQEGWSTIDELLEQAYKKAEAAPTVNMLEEVSTSFTVPQTELLEEALAAMVKQDILRPMDKTIFPYKSATGVARTSQIYGAGDGVRKEIMNAQKQYTVWRSLFHGLSERGVDARVKEIMNASGVRGRDRAYARGQAYKEIMLPILNMADEVFKREGIFPVAGTKAGDARFSLGELLTAIDDINPEWVTNNIFTMVKNPATKQYESIIAPTQLMEAMNAVVLDAIRLSDNPALGMGKFDWAKYLVAELGTVKKTFKGKTIPNRFAPKLAKMNKEDATVYAREMISPLLQSISDITAVAAENAARRKAFAEQGVAKADKIVKSELVRKIKQADGAPGQLIKAAEDVKTVTVRGAVRSTGLSNMDDPWAVDAVKAAADDAIAKVGLEGASTSGAKVADAATPAAKTKAAVGDTKQIMDDADELSTQMDVFLTDAIERGRIATAMGLVRHIAPHLGNERVRQIFLTHQSPFQNLARAYQDYIGKAAIKHSQAHRVQAFNALKTGIAPVDPAVKAAYNDISRLVHFMFDKDETRNVFARNNLKAEQLNDYLDHFGVSKNIRFDPDNINSSWKEWDVPDGDPLETLSKTYAAVMRGATERHIGNELMATFGSAEAKDGFIKIRYPKDSELGKFLDHDYYFPKDIVKEMALFDQTLIKMKEGPIKNDDVRKFMRVFDFAQTKWKTMMTIYRPGHHVRNEIGDVWFSFMAGVTSPVPYKKALEVMSQFQGSYKDLDIMRAIQAGDEWAPNLRQGKFPKLGDPSKTIATVRLKNGTKVQLNSSQIYKAAFNNSLLRDYRSLEDIPFGADESMGIGGKVLGRLSAPTGGRAKKVAAGLSEGRDHHIRLAHFINDLEKGTYGSLEEAIKKSSEAVRKWHPDGSDLSMFEQKYMRRLIPFYSWQRKAIPLILEGMVMNPGRAMVYPKGMYELAENNGIELDSLSNPFPTDQLFPEWMRDDLYGPTWGEQGAYGGLGPGIPMMDILGDYGSGESIGDLDPLKAVGGSTTIPVKLGLEQLLKIGGNEDAVAVDIRTGIPIFDKSDYLDRQLPFASYWTGVTGKSLSQPWQNKGDKDTAEQGQNPDAFFNFLTGLGKKDYSKPGYIKQAKRELTQERRNAAREARKNAQP